MEYIPKIGNGGFSMPKAAVVRQPVVSYKPPKNPYPTPSKTHVEPTPKATTAKPQIVPTSVSTKTDTVKISTEAMNAYNASKMFRSADAGGAPGGSGGGSTGSSKTIDPISIKLQDQIKPYQKPDPKSDFINQEKKDYPDPKSDYINSEKKFPLEPPKSLVPKPEKSVLDAATEVITNKLIVDGATIGGGAIVGSQAAKKLGMNPNSGAAVGATVGLAADILVNMYSGAEKINNLIKTGVERLTNADRREQREERERGGGAGGGRSDGRMEEMNR